VPPKKKKKKKAITLGKGRGGGKRGQMLEEKKDKAQIGEQISAETQIWEIPHWSSLEGNI
jgi:hypothetical protein